MEKTTLSLVPKVNSSQTGVYNSVCEIKQPPLTAQTGESRVSRPPLPTVVSKHDKTEPPLISSNSDQMNLANLNRNGSAVAQQDNK